MSDADPIVEARSLGWVPQEEFRGNVEKWVDAETFLERGKTVMPILKKNNEKLNGEVQVLRNETARLQQLFQASQEAIAELQKVHSENTKAAVEQARRDLLSSLKVAKENGDLEAEVRITDELTDLKAAQREASAAPAPVPASPPAPQQDALHPDFRAWMQENPWFGTDQRKTTRAQGVAMELRADEANDGLVGRAFFDRVVEVMEERTGASRVSRVGGARPNGSGGSGGGRTYADLPAEAKEACDRQGKKLVGEGRAFKDSDAWRKQYAATYFQQGA